MAEIIVIPPEEEQFVEPIELDFREKVNDITISIPQYDTNRRYIRATLFVNGQPFEATETQVITFSATKPDHTKLYNNAGIDDQGRVVYEITEQTTSSPGTFPARIDIYDTKVVGGVTVTRRTSSFNFKVFVQKSALSDDAVISTDEFKVLTDMIATVGDIITDGTALMESMAALETQVEEAETIRVSNENTRISNEEVRVEHDSVRPVWHYVTQAEYDALPSEDINNPLNIYQITNNPDATLISTLSDLLNQINIALAAVESSTVDINNINDAIVTTIQTWSSSKIVSRIRNYKYTASSTVSSITHGLDYNSTTDDLQVFYNGLLLEDGVNYTNSTDFHTINLTSWTVSSGDRVYFKLYKYVK